MMQIKNRPAVTLTEVLIAIFLMGIGLMAILSLFPLGASQMAQALQDQRASEAATMAAGYARVIWKQVCDDDSNVGQAKFYDIYGNPQSHQRFVEALDNPSFNGPSAAPTNDPTYVSRYFAAQFCMGDQGAPPGQVMPYSPGGGMQQIPRTGANLAGGSYVNATGPSYPVFVDPMGWQSNAANPDPAAKWWLPLPSGSVSGIQPWRIPRRPLYMKDTTVSPSQVFPNPPPSPPVMQQPWIALGSASQSYPTSGMPPSTQRIFKQFSLMDDMTFNYNGTPDLDGDQSTTDTSLASSQGVRRQGRYSWAFMFRRANNADRTAVDITTVLYSGRSIDVASQETAYLGTVQFPTVTTPGVTSSTKTVTLAYSGTKPALRRGNWILDATLNDISGNLLPQGIFYRVVNVDDSTAGQLALELQSPIMGDPYGTTPRQPTTRVFIVMDKVIEVFTKKDVSNVAPPMPY